MKHLLNLIIATIANITISFSAHAICSANIDRSSSQIFSLSQVLLKSNISASCGYLDTPYGVDGLGAHGGLDFPAPIGTSVYSATDGVVVNTNSSVGHVAVRLVDGRLVNYYHMDTILVSNGAGVTKNQKIGTVGTKGYSTGPHLHIEVRINYAGISAIGGASCGGSCSYTQIASMTANPTSLVTSDVSNDVSWFDGTGSLVDPRKYGSGCAQQQDNGCDNDVVRLHPRTTPSTALFQIVGTSGYCDSVQLSGLNGGAKVEIRSWSGYGTESIYYQLDSLPATIPLKNTNSGWNLLALTTTSPIPSGETRTISAKCVGSAVKTSNVHTITSSPTQFGGDYFWGGNGSIIGHSNNIDTVDTRAGYGRNQDSVALMRDQGTIAAIQVTANSCRNLVFTAPVALKLSWKKWDSAAWLGSKVLRSGETLSIPSEIANWAVVMIQAPSTGANGSRVDIRCL